MIVGNDVWLGFGATIMSGVNLGDVAVVGAMAVVTKDVDPYSIVAGNPAREVGKRFYEETIAALLKLRWWDWLERVIRENIPLLCCSDTDSFLTKCRKGDGTPA